MKHCFLLPFYLTGFFLCASLQAQGTFRSFESGMIVNHNIKVIPLKAFSFQLTQEAPPKMNSLNLAFRFALELGALSAMGWWGYEQTDDASRYLLMAGVPVAAAAFWGIFTVPDDPSRGQNGPVAVSGVTRLLIEGAVLGFGSWALHDLGEDPMALGFGGAVVLHYSFSIDRIKWLLKQ